MFHVFGLKIKNKYSNTPLNDKEAKAWIILCEQRKYLGILGPKIEKVVQLFFDEKDPNKPINNISTWKGHHSNGISLSEKHVNWFLKSLNNDL